MEKLRRLPENGSSPSRTWKTGSFCDYKNHIVDNTILLRDWYLIKSLNAHNGKRLAVGGILSKGDHDVKDFQSAPIIQRLHTFKLRTADGLIILLTGLIDGQRTFENGFPSEVLSYFQIGFPFTWEALAKVYISSDGTSCSSSGHDNDVNELKHSVGRARCVRIFSDDEKWSKSDSASELENDISIQSSFDRKTEGKPGSFLKGSALHMPSNPMTFSPSDAWKSKDKGTLHKYNISSSESALGLGSVQKFDDDGKIAPYDGDKCVKSCLDEAIPSQTLLDTPNNISMGTSCENRGMKPDHECEHVNGDKKEHPSYKLSQMEGTGNEDCKSLPKPPECSRHMLKANIPVQNLRGGDGNVCKDPEIKNICGPEIMSATESGTVMPLATTTFKRVPAGLVSSPVVLTHKNVPCQPGRGTPADAKSVVFAGNSVGESIRDASKLVIGGSTARSKFETLEDENVESENDSLDQSPVERTKTCQLGLSEELSQRDAQMKLETIKVTKKDASSVAPSIQRVTRYRARLSSFEDIEKEEHNGYSGLKDGCDENATIPMDCPKDALLDMDGSTSGASEFGIEGDKMSLDAETDDDSHKITMKTTSSCLSSQKKGKRGCSAQQGANGEDVAVSISCRNAFLNMYGRTPNSSGGKKKDKMGLFANSFDSGQRITRSRSMSSSLRCSQKEGDGDCHIQKGTSNTDICDSESCFKRAACDSKSGPTEIGVGEIKYQRSLDNKTLGSDEMLRSSNTIGHGTTKRKLQYGHATDINTRHAGRHLSSTVGRDQIESLVRQRSEVSDDLKESKHSSSENVATGNLKKRKARFLHACRPFIPSSSAEKSSSTSGKAFNLKMSSSGRLIVPPLAHWRNEQIVYDTEGGITCIFDGSQVIGRPGTRSSNIVTRSRKTER